MFLKVCICIHEDCNALQVENIINAFLAGRKWSFSSLDLKVVRNSYTEWAANDISAVRFSIIVKMRFNV